MVWACQERNPTSARPGNNVTRTVRKFRQARDLGYAELSRMLAELGRKIPPLGLRRIEAGERRVDVDDLMALAMALDVAPVALLLPSRQRMIPGWCRRRSDPWQHIWLWGTGLQPPSGDVLMFIRDSNPLKWAHVVAIALNSAAGRPHAKRRGEVMATISKYQTSSGATLYRVRYRTPEQPADRQARLHLQARGRTVRRHRGGRQDARGVRLADAGPGHRGRAGTGVAGPPAGPHEAERVPGIRGGLAVSMSSRAGAAPGCATSGSPRCRRG